MDIDHVHFYVEDAERWRDWLIHTLGCQSLLRATDRHTLTEVVGSGEIRFVLSSALSSSSPVVDYLRLHPAGVVDLAFRVSSLEAVLDRALQQGAQLLHPIQIQPYGKWAQIAGWGVKHTIVEGVRWLPTAAEAAPLLSGVTRASIPNCYPEVSLTRVDHAVLNVAAGDLHRAIAWYELTLGFQRQQRFAIQTEYSGLCSQVLVHPEGAAQLPINEPASATSQIQEFLNENRGAGVQHIALQAIDIVTTIARLRQNGLSFLQVPATYYAQLRQRSGFPFSGRAWQAIARQEVLVDWEENRPEAALLQAFTQPIFGQPTFFFELIERQQYWSNQQCYQAQGFGEGNFQALFEAIEREQRQRGSLR